MQGAQCVAPLPQPAGICLRTCARLIRLIRDAQAAINLGA